ncbi:putative carboxypeptidase Y inhibitor [Rhexocercosporidium sp. MPI-PUGE-AT-0058]|nr:putative carboxypeptidase Y inhibitor [Rhexocercosporidium sp. MPI-PUGE-AT-0058]
MRFSIPLILTAAATSSLASLTAQDQIPLNQNNEDNGNGKADAVRKALTKASIITEVLDDFKPKCFITAYYNKNSGKTHQGAVDLGNKFKPKETKERPGLSISCPDLKSTPGLVVALTDPDAKSRDNPKWSEMCHWIYIIPTKFQPTAQAPLEFSIPISETSDSESDLVEYKPPGPPPKTGYHRYVFVILEGGTTNLTAPGERQHWGTGKVRHGVRDWAGKEGLSVVGANWFIEEDEEQ